MTSTPRSPYALGAGAGGGHMQVVDLTDLHTFCRDLLQRAGLDHDSADLVADSLTDAEARGISSHGVSRMRIYSQRLKAGLLDPEATPQVVSETASIVQIDAHNAIGHVGARAGVDAAMAKASVGGAGVAGVRNSNHCGTLAYFGRRAAQRNLVAIAASNAPPTMVYHGGRTRAVGTNPICFAVPRSDGPALVVDMATSATARGKIILANQIGNPIPEGWAVDKDGRPTTDPVAALEGSVLPFAGPKGSGLAMMIDLLCGTLLGGPSGAGIGDMYEDWSRPQQVGHLFIVLDPASWQGTGEFLTAVADFAAEVHSLAPAQGVARVLLPGEIEEAALASAEAAGVPISAAVVADLNALAAELGAGARLQSLQTNDGVEPDPWKSLRPPEGR